MQARLPPLALLLLLLLLLLYTSTSTTAAATQDAAASGGRPWRYDVFLSFRGADVRHSFIDHLYHGLVRKGIKPFKDELDLLRGQNITEAIPRAIEESRFSVVVLSKGYASSRWCLDELVKIVECTRDDKKGRRRRRHQPFPVFYHLSPADASDVSSGCYKRDFDRHKRHFSYDRVNSWRRALTSISHIAGWVLPMHGSEAQLVDDIASNLLLKIRALGRRDDHGVEKRNFGTKKSSQSEPTLKAADRRISSGCSSTPTDRDEESEAKLAAPIGT